MGSRLRTGILVTFFTALIWVLAEGESLQTKRTVVDVEFPTTAAEAYTARLADGGSRFGRVEVVVEGSTTSLDGLDEVLRRAVSLTPGMDGVPRESGEHTVDLREALRGHPEFRSRGVTVLTVEPATARVVVEELTTRSLPIRVEAPTEALDGPAQLAGADQAQVRLPVRVARGLAEGVGMVARVTNEALASLQEGARSTIQVRVEPGVGVPGGEILGIVPVQVGVQLTVRSKTRSTTLDSVAVDVRLPPGELGRWDIEIPLEEQSLRNVRVTGPASLIGQIESGSLRVRAFVRLSYEDLEGGVASRRAEFTELPTALSFEVEDADVRLKVRRRVDGSAGDGGGSPG